MKAGSGEIGKERVYEREGEVRRGGTKHVRAVLFSSPHYRILYVSQEYTYISFYVNHNTNGSSPTRTPSSPDMHVYCVNHMSFA